MENQQRSDTLFSIVMDEQAKEHLRTATLWAKIVAIVAFVSAFLSLLTAIFTSDRDPAKMGANIFGTLLTSVVSIVLNLILFRFARKTAESLKTANQNEFSEGVEHLRRYFKILGILLIVGMSLGLVALLFMGAGLTRM